MSDPKKPSVMPMLAYDDAPAAIEFLCKAFGFTETFRMDMPDGTVGHAELALGDGVVSLATTWTAGGLSSPRNLPAVHTQLFLRVDDVDEHYARARAEGATVVGEPRDEDHGERSYRAMDPEGHRWLFAGPLRGSK